MVTKTTTITVQIDNSDKEPATKILAKFNLNICDYIKMAIKELLEALKEGEDILNGKVRAKNYSNMNELLADLKF